MKINIIEKSSQNFFLPIVFLLCFIPPSTFKLKNESTTYLSIILDTSTVEKKLTKFKYSKYKNKSIGELLKGINITYERIVFVRMKPQYLSFVTVVYSKDIRLDIYTHDYKYLKRELQANESYEEMWKVDDLMKEQVTKIRVRKSDGTSLKEYPKVPILPVI